MSLVINSPYWLSVSFGIRIHFCKGAHILFPQGERLFHLRVTSLANGESVYDGDVQTYPEHPVEFVSRQTFYVPWNIEITQKGQRVFLYTLNLTGKQVCLDCTSVGSEEKEGWLAACDKFQKEFNCRLFIMQLRKENDEALKARYPVFQWITPLQFRKTDYLATYSPADSEFRDFVYALNRV